MGNGFLCFLVCLHGLEMLGEKEKDESGAKLVVGFGGNYVIIMRTNWF